MADVKRVGKQLAEVNKTLAEFPPDVCHNVPKEVKKKMANRVDKIGVK